MLFVHGKEKGRQHNGHHEHNRPTNAQYILGQKENGNANGTPNGEANQLSLGHVQHDFYLDFIHIARNRHSSHRSTPLGFCGTAFLGSGLACNRSKTDNFSFGAEVGTGA